LRPIDPLDALLETAPCLVQRFRHGGAEQKLAAALDKTREVLDALLVQRRRIRQDNQTEMLDIFFVDGVLIDGIRVHAKLFQPRQHGLDGGHRPPISGIGLGFHGLDQGDFQGNGRQSAEPNRRIDKLIAGCAPNRNPNAIDCVPAGRSPFPGKSGFGNPERLPTAFVEACPRNEPTLAAAEIQPQFAHLLRIANRRVQQKNARGGKIHLDFAIHRCAIHLPLRIERRRQFQDGAVSVSRHIDRRPALGVPDGSGCRRVGETEIVDGLFGAEQGTDQ